MASFNEILAGRFNRALQKMLSMKGDPPAPTLAGEIAAIHNFQSGRENRYLEGWNSFAGSFSVAAGGAGNVGIFQVFNPASSRVVAVFEKICWGGQIAAAQAALMNYSNSGAQLTGALAISNIGLDNRGSATPVVQFQNKNNSATGLGGITIWNGSQPANQVVDVIVTDIQEIPLLPNEALLFSPTTANLAFAVNLIWRERVLEDSEVF